MARTHLMAFFQQLYRDFEESDASGKSVTAVKMSVAPMSAGAIFSRLRVGPSQRPLRLLNRLRFWPANSRGL